MISPVWVELGGVDGNPAYVNPAQVGAVEATPEGARIRVDGEWIYVTDEPSVVLDRLIKAGEFSTEAALYMAKEILDTLLGKDAETVH